jgi:hypothetical protein
MRMVRRNPDGFRDEHEEFGTRVVETGHNGSQPVEVNATSQMTPPDAL